MADQKNKLGLSVAIGAGVGAALGVALHHLPLWLSLGCVVTGIILRLVHRTTADRRAAHRKSDQRRGCLCGGGPGSICAGSAFQHSIRDLFLRPYSPE